MHIEPLPLLEHARDFIELDGRALDAVAKERLDRLTIKLEAVPATDLLRAISNHALVERVFKL